MTYPCVDSVSRMGGDSCCCAVSAEADDEDDTTTAFNGHISNLASWFDAIIILEFWVVVKAEAMPGV